MMDSYIDWLNYGAERSSLRFMAVRLSIADCQLVGSLLTESYLYKYEMECW